MRAKPSSGIIMPLVLLIALIATTPSALGQTVTVTLANLTRGGTNFIVGDQVSVTITGPAYSPVSYVQYTNGIQIGTGQVSFGSIPSNGVLSVVAGYQTMALAGPNSQTWCVGGSQQCPSMCPSPNCVNVSYLVLPLLPSGKEYIRLGTRVVAIEYFTPPIPVEQLLTPTPAVATNNTVNFVIQDIDSAPSNPSVNDVTNVGLLINAPFNGANACYMELTNGTGGLFANDGTTFMQFATSPPTSNAQCTLNSISYTTNNGNVRQWQAQVTFASAFLNTGPNVYAFAQTASGQSEWDSVTSLSSGTLPLMPATKIGIVRASTGQSNYFWILDANGNTTFDGNLPGQDRLFALGGLCGDVLITGDWNGDGRTKGGIYRFNASPPYAAFILDYDGDGQITAADKVYYFSSGTALASDIPVTGNWTGDGKTKIGIYRSTTGAWYLDSNGDGAFTSGVDSTYYFGGQAGDLPVTGDWSGNGRSKIGIFRQGFYWMLDSNGNGVFDSGSDAEFAYGGVAGDLPVVGDWRGTGTSQVGIFRQHYYWILDADGDHSVDSDALTFPFGGISATACGQTLYDVPVTGRW